MSADPARPTTSFDAGFAFNVHPFESLPPLIKEAEKLKRHPPCGRGTLIGRRDDDGAILLIPLTCKKWVCPNCRPFLLARWRRTLLAGAPERKIELTCSPKDFASPWEMRVAMARALTSLVQAARRKWGTFEYAYVWELHKSGYPHLHILQRGAYIPFAWLSARWRKLTGGSHVYIEKVGDAVGGARYLLKYMAKGVSQTAAAFPGKRIIGKSKAWCVPEENPEKPELRPGVAWARIGLGIWVVLEALSFGGARLLGDWSADGALPVDVSHWESCHDEVAFALDICFHQIGAPAPET